MHGRNRTARRVFVPLRRWRSSFRTCTPACVALLGLVLVLFFAWPGLAQSVKLPSDNKQSCKDSTDGVDEYPKLVLMVELERGGNLELTQIHYAKEGVESPPLPFSVLQAVANCPLEHGPEEAPDVWGGCEARYPVHQEEAGITLHLAPLADALRQNHDKTLMVQFFAPEGVSVGCPPAFTRLASNGCYIDLPVTDTISNDIAFTYLYPGASGAQILLVLGGIFLAAPLLTCLLWWAAARTKTDDKTGVWFSYVRFMQWSFIVPFFAWAGAVDSLDPLRWLAVFGPSWAVFDNETTHWPRQALIWLAPICSWLLCVAISHPVRKALQRTRMSLRESVLQGFLYQASTWIPLALFLQAIFDLIADDRWAPLWFIAAVVVRVVAAPALMRVSGMQPQAITQGPLRNRAFALAERMGVKLGNLYYMPTARAPMANAFAHRARMIFLTDYLLEKLSRSEVDAVIGHELGHLKRNHSVKLFTAYLVILAPMFWIKPYVMQSLHLPEFTQYLVLNLPALAGMFAFSRRFEYEADREAAAVTEQPEAMVSALAKLTRLNSMPVRWSHWDELLMTHPSTLRRSRALLKRTGMPSENVMGLLAAAAERTNGADHYPIPSAVNTRLFSTAHRTRVMQIVTWTLYPFATVCPALFAFAARQLSANETLKWPVYAAGLLATLAGYYWLMNSVGCWLLPSLKRSFERRALAEGMDIQGGNALFVGLAPGDTPRLYEYNMSWDAGFLFLTRERLVYWGEEARFALTREQVESIESVPDVPSWQSAPRPNIQWRESPGSPINSFCLQPLDIRSMFERRQKMSALSEILTRWKRGEALDTSLPAACAALDVPRIGEVTGFDQALLAQPQLIVRSLIFLLLIGACVSLAFRLPFGVYQVADATLAPKDSAPLTVVRLDLGAWYVAVVSALALLTSMLPLFRYRRASRGASRAPAAPVRA